MLNAEDKSHNNELYDVFEDINGIMGKVLQTLTIVCHFSIDHIIEYHRKEILKQIDIPDAVQIIQDEIISVIENAEVSEDKVAKCLNSEKHLTQTLKKNLQILSYKCTENIHKKLTLFKYKLSKIEQKGYVLFVDTKQIITKLVQNNLILPMNSIKLLLNETQKILRTGIIDFCILKGENTIDDIINELNDSVVDIQKLMKEEQLSIIRRFKECIGSIDTFIQHWINGNQKLYTYQIMWKSRNSAIKKKKDFNINYFEKLKSLVEYHEEVL